MVILETMLWFVIYLFLMHVIVMRKFDLRTT